MGINFHEVRARSALNHVPGGRFGFNWTINPYRGCTHACVYCLAGDTPILMADGRTEAARGPAGRRRDLRHGAPRHLPALRDRPRCSPTGRPRKAAYRVTLEDGTELIASGDHRFLTDRGWKYVTGRRTGPAAAPAS